MRISDFKALTFDCYGTLIDWEAGILAELKPWARSHGKDLSDDQLLEDFASVESPIQAKDPSLKYPAVLAEVHRTLARKWKFAPDEKAALAFGQSVPRWPAFPDSAAALSYLKDHFTLVILSNIDDDSIKASAEKLGRPFHHIYTAQQIGSYKPDRRNFAYMITKLAALGIAKGQILHVAQSLFHDHEPAQGVGLSSVWIDRRAGKSGAGATQKLAKQPEVQARYETLAQFADAHRAELRAG